MLKAPLIRRASVFSSLATSVFIIVDDSLTSPLTHKSAELDAFHYAGYKSRTMKSSVRTEASSDSSVPSPNEDIFRVVSTSKDSNFDIDYMGESTKGDMKLDRTFQDSLGWKLHFLYPRSI